MNRLAFFGCFIIILIVSGSVFLIYKNNNSKTLISENTVRKTLSPTASPNILVDIQASFAIFTNGTFRIFSDERYQNLSKDVYLQNPNPNIVIVKKENITWNDFFKTLPMQLSKDCLITGTKQTFCTGAAGSLKFYINGVEDPNSLDKTIHQNDKLLVSFGDETEEKIQNQFQQIPNP